MYLGYHESYEDRYQKGSGLMCNVACREKTLEMGMRLELRLELELLFGSGSQLGFSLVRIRSSRIVIIVKR